MTGVKIDQPKSNTRKSTKKLKTPSRLVAHQVAFNQSVQSLSDTEGQKNQSKAHISKTSAHGDSKLSGEKARTRRNAPVNPLEESHTSAEDLKNAGPPLGDLVNALSIKDCRRLENEENIRRKALKNSCPEKQADAIGLLMDESASRIARQEKLSPLALGRLGLVQYGLRVIGTEKSLVPDLLIMRMKSPDVTKSSRTHLTNGRAVTLCLQYESPNDPTSRKGSHPPTESIKGVISETGKNIFEVVIAKRDSKRVPSSNPIQIECADSIVHFQRMIDTIEYYRLAEKSPHNKMPALAELARGRGEVKVASKPTRLNPQGLNNKQLETVKHGIGSNLCLIRGAAGTGKSIVLRQIVLELLRDGETVLICCGSHTAVDNLVERLSSYAKRYPIARLGHPYRISPSTRHHSIELLRQTGKHFKWRSIRIIATTLHDSGNLALFPAVDTIVIDEVCQALHAQCWIPLLGNRSAKRLIIAGDDKQLSPNTLNANKNQVRKTLALTLFDVLLACYGKKVLHVLNTQYRMSEDIMQFPAQFVYDGLLDADKKVSSQRLHDVPRVMRSPITSSSLVWVDTSSQGYTEKAQAGGGSWGNPTEAALVKNYCSRLQEQGVRLSDIGIITPYAAQRDLIQRMVPSVEVNTVDGYQGREKNAIVLSLVRSNEKGTVGFMAEERRLNVAITRAKYQLCVIADMNTLRQCKNKLLNEWAAWCEEHATIIHPDAQGKLPK